MKHLFLIGVIIWLGMQCIYDRYIWESDTNAAIFYWAGLYIPFALFIFNEILRRRNVNLLIIYFGIAIYLIYDTVYSFTLIGSSYSIYESKVQDIPTYECGLIVSLLVVINTIFKNKKLKRLLNKILWVKL